MFPGQRPDPTAPIVVLAFAGPTLRGRLEREGIEVIGCGSVADALRGCPRFKPQAILLEEGELGDATEELLGGLRAACGAACPVLVVFADRQVVGADMVVGEPWDGPTVRSLLGRRRGPTNPPASGPISAPVTLPPSSGPVLRSITKPSFRAGVERAVVLEALGKVADPATAEGLLGDALRRALLDDLPADRALLEAFLLDPLAEELADHFDRATAKVLVAEVCVTLGLVDAPSSVPLSAPVSTPRDERRGRSGHSSGTYRVVGQRAEEGVDVSVVLVETSLEGPERRLRRVAGSLEVIPWADAATEAQSQQAVLVAVHDVIFDGRALAADLRDRGHRGPILVLVDEEEAPPNVTHVDQWLEMAWPASRPRLRRALQHAAAQLEPMP